MITEVGDQLHGDRVGAVRDPFGHRWVIATRTEDMTAAEMQHRMEAWMAEGARA